MCSIIVRNKLTLLKEICWILKIIVEHFPSIVILTLVSLRVVLTLSVPWTIVEVSIIIIILVRVSVLRVLIT